jgi:hypothetical protein
VYCTLHCTCTVYPLSLVRMTVRDSDVLAWVRGQRKMSQELGGVWAAGFHRVTVRSRLARVLKHTNRLFLLVFQFFRDVVNRGKCISEYGDTPVYKFIHLY